MASTMVRGRPGRCTNGKVIAAMQEPSLSMGADRSVTPGTKSLPTCAKPRARTASDWRRKASYLSLGASRRSETSHSRRMASGWKE